MDPLFSLGFSSDEVDVRLPLSTYTTDGPGYETRTV